MFLSHVRLAGFGGAVHNAGLVGRWLSAIPIYDEVVYYRDIMSIYGEPKLYAHLRRKFREAMRKGK